MSTMNTLAVILARAGSKGLVGKNALPVAGKSMVTWTIEHALGSKCVNRVVLSTDGEEIAAEGRRLGIDVVPRPPELASDTATVDSAARHAVNWAEQGKGESYDNILILYGNVPVRPADLSDRAVKKLTDTGADSVQSVCAVGKMHPCWMQKLTGQGSDTLEAYQANDVYRRQDLPPVYVLDGGVIAVTRKSLFTIVDGQPHAFLGTDRRAIVTQPGEVIDVDNELDLAIAETILNGNKILSEAAGAARHGP